MWLMRIRWITWIEADARIASLSKVVIFNFIVKYI